MIISYMFSSPTTMVVSDRYSFFLAIEVAGVFLLFRNLVTNINTEGMVYKFIFALAKYSYGIYLFHYFVIYRLFGIFKRVYTPVLMIILLVLVVIICLAVMSILNRIPYLNQVIGAK